MLRVRLRDKGCLAWWLLLACIGLFAFVQYDTYRAGWKRGRASAPLPPICNATSKGALWICDGVSYVPLHIPPPKECTVALPGPHGGRWCIQVELEEGQ